jgi:hypothetical protein
MSDITGARGTANVEQTTRSLDIRPNIALLEPNLQPLAVIASKVRKERTVSPKFQWYTDEGEPRYDAVNNGAGYNSAATSIVVDDGTKFEAHTIFQITRTSENIRVTGVAANTLTVVRGVGGGAAAIVDNDEIVILGSAQPEGDTSKPARSDNPDLHYNYTQIHRTPIEATGTLRASSFVVKPSDWPHQSRKKGIEHGKSREYAFLHGKKSEDTSGSQPRRTTGGIISAVQTNQYDAGGQLTRTEFNTGMRLFSRYTGGKARLGIASALAVSVLNEYPASNLQWKQDESTFGINVGRFVTPFGNLNLVTHWLLEGAKYGGYMLVIDVDELAVRFLANDEENRDTHIRQNIQQPDADTRKDEWLTEDGLEAGEERRHGVFTGITS